MWLDSFPRNTFRKHFCGLYCRAAFFVSVTVAKPYVFAPSSCGVLRSFCLFCRRSAPKTVRRAADNPQDFNHAVIEPGHRLVGKQAQGRASLAGDGSHGRRPNRMAFPLAAINRNLTDDGHSTAQQHRQPPGGCILDGIHAPFVGKSRWRAWVLCIAICSID